jgi:hypothetical protein
MSRSLLDSALHLARRGFRVFPLHGIVRGNCTCGKADCASPGKHPKIKDWQHKATSEPTVVAGFWKKWPDANIAIATGGESRLFVLDIDPDGEASLQKLIDQHGPLPETLTVTTGRGRHLYFEAPDAE